MSREKVYADRATYEVSVELLQSARVRYLLERSPEASRALLFAWEAHTAATRQLNHTTRRKKGSADTQEPPARRAADAATSHDEEAQSEPSSTPGAMGA